MDDLSKQIESYTMRRLNLVGPGGGAKLLMRIESGDNVGATGLSPAEHMEFSGV